LKILYDKEPRDLYTKLITDEAVQSRLLWNGNVDRYKRHKIRRHFLLLNVLGKRSLARPRRW